MVPRSRNLAVESHTRLITSGRKASRDDLGLHRRDVQRQGRSGHQCRYAVTECFKYHVESLDSTNRLQYRIAGAVGGARHIIHNPTNSRFCTTCPRFSLPWHGRAKPHAVSPSMVIQHCTTAPHVVFQATWISRDQGKPLAEPMAGLITFVVHDQDADSATSRSENRCRA